MKDNIELEQKPVIVTIRCLVYNHEPYLRQCLDGFIMQKTNFRFEAIVHDDASTDGSAAIIREYAEKYPDIIKPILEKENQYSKGNGILRKIIVSHIRGKYVAFCEGDDYWTNPAKLQMQVDFMDSHPEYSLCFSDVIYYNTDIKKSKGKISIISKKANMSLEALSGEQLFKKILVGGCYIQTLSAMYRTKDFINIPPNDTYFSMGDTPLWLDLSQQGKVKYIDEVMGVYNVHRGSSTHTDSKKRLRFDLSIEEMRVYYCRKYNYEIPVIVKRKYNKAYMRLLASDIDFSALYEPFAENKLQMWQIRQLREKTWYFTVYNKLILPIQKIVDYIRIKAKILWSIIWNKI